ncbi:MAG: hypothetical protein CMA78_03840 [Euryarchaeota archaeon]|nr:hypothetical protein [Euryarchaeota archaeon]|tara:strand:- start:28352 stop:28765 length:414 start_codon:yes stop_codon:yes gene_type:complete
MEEASGPEWRIHGLVGAALLINVVFLKISIDGPWDSETFTLGLIGSVSIALFYVSWYRLTFRRRGLIPWVDLWKEPSSSAKKVLLSSLIVLSMAWLSGNHLQQILPTPTGLVLSLIGFLMLTQSAYVLMSIGPLSDD